MDDNTRAKLEMEQAKGEQYQRTWDTVLEPFFKAKQEELFEAFQSISSSKTNDLVNIKLQSNALMMLEDEIHHYISAGKVARHQLNEE